MTLLPIYTDNADNYYNVGSSFNIDNSCNEYFSKDKFFLHLLVYLFFTLSTRLPVLQALLTLDLDRLTHKLPTYRSYSFCN